MPILIKVRFVRILHKNKKILPSRVPLKILKVVFYLITNLHKRFYADSTSN